MPSSTPGSSPFWSSIFSRKGDWKQEASRLFAQSPLFDGVPARVIRHLVDDMFYRRYEDGEAVFEVGDPGLGLYLVLDGRVNIHIKEKTLAELGSGDIFGEVALFGDEVRTASARVVGATQLVGFFRPALEEWVERSPRQGALFVLRLGQMLAERLRRTNDRLLAAEREQSE